MSRRRPSFGDNLIIQIFKQTSVRYGRIRSLHQIKGKLLGILLATARVRNNTKFREYGRYSI